MASIEFIQKRIEGKEKEIAKLEKKMERILKAQASNWENNPYYYGESDLKWTSRDLDKAREALEGYKAQMAKETEKANSRNIPAILDFLEGWKEKVRGYYTDCLPRYLDARNEWYRYSREHCDWFNSRARLEASKEEYKQVMDEYREKEKAFKSAWNWFVPYVEKEQLNMAKLNKELEQDANAKYDFIIERTNEIVGTITDASNLSVGRKGDLNGFIIGERGKAKVETIGAGGYNIQCYHFRTLIHAM